MGNQFMFGAQLGWVSLGGRSNFPQNHVYDLLMDPAYGAEILYLKRLSSAKAVAADYFNHGSALRKLDLIINGTKDDFGVKYAPGHPRGRESFKDDSDAGLVFPAVMSTAWRSGPGDSILLSFTTVRRDASAEIDALLDLGKYGIQPEEPS